MVVTQLLGGLGNQLFQYAVGRAVAQAHGTRLKLDVAAFDQYRLRPYALQCFRTEADLLSSDEARRLDIPPRPGMLGALRRLMRRSAMTMVSEASFEFDPAVLSARPPCYLKGYWQSPRYFESVEPQIRRELTLATPLAGENRAVADAIESALSVSVHIRRGDYVSNAQTNQYHGTCDAAYYYEAERQLRARLGEFRLFVFSDDPQWVRDNLRFSSPASIVSHNPPDQGHEDLRLMTMCRHHIIANSTFSWWGAWLCQHGGKTVVAPRNWFREAGHRSDDLIPRGWIRV